MPVAKGTKNKKIEATEKETVLATVKPLNHSVVIDELGKTQVKVQKTLADLSSELTSRITQLETVQSAIGIMEERLSDLHEIEAAAVSLDELRAQIDSERVAADEAESARLVAINEKEAERVKAKQREEDEYTYKTAQARKKATDDFNALVAQKQRDEQIREEGQKRAWAEREAALKAQEKEVSDLRIKVANIPTEIATAAKEQVGAAIGRITKDNDHATSMLKLQNEADRKLAEAANASKDATINSLRSQITTLQEELKAANGRAETIASKALDASSGRQALEAVERNAQNVQSTTKSNGR